MNQTNTNRFVQDVKVDMPLIKKVLNFLELSSLGDITVPEDGRIASNVCVETEIGKVMLRFYPKGYQADKLETGSVDFEIETLSYLSSNGIAVPAPLLSTSGEYQWDEGGIKIFAYRLLPGESLKITDLTTSIASQCGKLLKEMIEVTQRYQPSDTAPEGDLEYFLKIYKTLISLHPELESSKELKEMADFTWALHQKGQVSQTPKGIVHADFFFENILKSPDGSMGVIDFGDAYYGHVVMDIAIGSMEFSVLEDSSWDFDMFESFLAEHAEWLKENHITSDMFYSLLAANCLRFAVYIMPSTLEDKEQVSENPYVIRFYQLMNPELKSRVENAYNRVIQ